MSQAEVGSIVSDDTFKLDVGITPLLGLVKVVVCCVLLLVVVSSAVTVLVSSIEVSSSWIELDNVGMGILAVLVSTVNWELDALSSAVDSVVINS